jgi:A/G-specific adenine glycosylase
MKKRVLQKIPGFKKKIYTFYKENKREFDWRNTTDPYKIIVSEMMLQQTQTGRVIEKYADFIHALPSVSHLAKAPTSEVLRLWQGLGYNRRALYLKRTAEIICETYNNAFPSLKEELVKLPGVGPNTAGAVMAFAYNLPVVFIETNIRRVFIHEFFREKEKVSDQQIYPFIENSLDTKNPRDWYYALMDYGAYIGKTTTNPNRKSETYSKQSKFEGSIRQVRGAILKLLLEKVMSETALSKQFENKEFYNQAIKQLIKEGFVEKIGNSISLKS